MRQTKGGEDTLQYNADHVCMLSAGEFRILSDKISYMRYFEDTETLLVHVVDGKYINITDPDEICEFLTQYRKHLLDAKVPADNMKNYGPNCGEEV